MWNLDNIHWIKVARGGEQGKLNPSHMQQYTGFNPIPAGGGVKKYWSEADQIFWLF